MHAPKRDTYQVITDAILAALDTCGQYERPWQRSGVPLTMPKNAVTGRRYRGSNIVMLWVAAQDAGYSDNRWATFRQWAEKGASVRKGEKGTPVLWFQMLDRKDGADESGRKLPCARLSWVFNVAQIDGYAADAVQLENQVTPIEQADALLTASGASITHSGDSAYYRPGTDQIVLPPREAFTGTATMTATEAYYATACHELVHWTGPRLQRDLGKRFGDDAYAAEELVAELGAAFLCATLGISAEPRMDHVAYLAHWSRMLRSDRRAFVTAASKASEACDFLLAFVEAEATELEQAA